MIFRSIKFQLTDQLIEQFQYKIKYQIYILIRYKYFLIILRPILKQLSNLM